MKKSLLVTLLVIVGAAVAWSAAAQDCQYHNAKIDFRPATVIDSEDYDICVDGAKLVGTLNGTYGYCFNFDTFITSTEIFGDIWEQIETAKYDSWIETRKGTLTIREWSWFDYDFFVEVGFAKVIGGTGVFEGKVGELAWYPRWPSNSGWANPLQGYICTPEDQGVAMK